MSERPAAGTDPVAPPSLTFWGKNLWGTEIHYGQNAKLVIDADGVGHFTDAAGETARWVPDLAAWVDDAGQIMEGTFGPPGMELSADQLELAADRLEQLANEHPDPVISQGYRERAAELREQAKWAAGGSG